MIKTHEELLQKIKQYESKWGKLGHTNIMQPELKHTGLKGGSKMLKMDNEYYEFRRKVAEGSKKNRLAHASTISPDELNERYEQELVDRGSLIHAANGMKGQQFQNTKYYKREGEPGHYRYYYTKEEWDAAHGNGSAADANREAQARSAYETNKKIENYKNKQNVTNTSSNTRENNLQADFTKKFSDIARQSPEAAAKEIVKDDNTKIKTFYNKINDGFRKGIIVWKNGRFEMGENSSDSDYENIKDEIEAYSDQLEKFVKDVDAAAGSGRKTKDAIAKIMVDEIESMYQKAEKGKENLKANQNSREEDIKRARENDKQQKIKDEFKKQDEIRMQDSNTDDAFDDLIQGLQTYTYKYDKHYDFKTRLNEKLGDNFSKVGSEFVYKNKEYDDKIKEVSDKWNDLNNDRDSDGNIQHWDEMNKLSSEWSKLENEKNKAKYSELMSAISEVINEYPSKEKSNIYSELNHLIGYGYMNKYNQDDFNINIEVKDFLKKLASGEEIIHSFSKSNHITSSAMGDEIIDEYKAFQEKVKVGAERHRLTHSSFISPEELNAKYQEELENNRILCHASNGQNYGYYQKIEKYYPDGSTRYFYTKEQWDAYQKNLELTNKAKEKEKIDKQKKESYEKNKAAAEAQKKAESDKWDTHKKIREDFHQVPGYMTYSSTFVDDMKATPEGSNKGKEFLFNAMKDAYKKYPAIENIRTDASKYNNVKPKDSEVFGFMDEVQKGIDKYTKDFIKKYQLPEDEYTPLINNYFLNMADQLMKDNKLDYNYVQDVYYRNSDLGKKEAKKEEILKQGDFNNRIFREDYKNKWNKYNEIFDKDYDRDSEVYKVNLQNFADNGQESKYLKETIESLKKRRTNDGKPQYSDEDIYNAAYTFLWKNFQKQAVDSNYAFSPSLRNLVPDILKAMGYDGEYTADWDDLIIKLK